MLSLNVRGIRSLEKRKALLIWLNKQNADIIFLQETYVTKDVENVWRCQWKGPIFYGHDSNRSCGVLVLLKDHLEFEVKSVLTDNKGRYILLNANKQGTDYFLGNIYAPNKVQQQCSFFDEIQSKLDDFISDPELKVIIDVVTDLDLDCFGGSPTEKESAKRVKDICLNCDLIDIWRIRNPDCKRFTWRQRNPLIQRRVDFWLISDSCQDEVEETDIKTAIRTDHSAITISFNSASLIEDENYVTLMNQKIPEWSRILKTLMTKECCGISLNIE